MADSIEQTNQRRGSNRGKGRTLLIMVAIFGLPYGLAWLFYFNPQLLDLGSRANGTLISPVVSPTEYQFQQLDGQPYQLDKQDPKWLFTAFGPSNCGEACQKTLFTLQQLRRMMGVDRAQISRAYVVLDNEILSTIQPELTNFEGTELVRLAGESISKFEQKAGIASGQLENHLVLIDPHGNLVMHYPRDMEPKKIFADIEILFGRVKGV